jgi:soluble lytic murein transglycosylase-like protein
MQRLGSAIVLTVALLCVRSPASAGSLVDRYATALRAFAPGLSGTRAHALAERTVAEADRYGLDARLVVALVAVESSWRTDAVSPAGARGLGQLMPGTAADLGVDPDDPAANVHGTVVYLRAMLDRYAARSTQARFECALAAYNAGPGAVDRYGAIPPIPETQAYVRRVIGLWRRLAGV